MKYRMFDLLLALKREDSSVDKTTRYLATRQTIYTTNWKSAVRAIFASC